MGETIRVEEPKGVAFVRKAGPSILMASRGVSGVTAIEAGEEATPWKWEI